MIQVPNTLRLKVGDPYRKPATDDSLQSLKEALALDGLYQGQVRADLHPDPATRQMDITVHVIPGLRARSGAISLKNMTPYADRDLLSRIKLKPADQIDSKKLQRAEDRLRDYLVKQDYLGAHATLHRGAYDPKTSMVQDFNEQEQTGSHQIAEGIAPIAGTPVYTRTYETSKLEDLHYRVLFAGVGINGWAVEVTTEFADPRDTPEQQQFLASVYDAARKEIVAK